MARWRVIVPILVFAAMVMLCNEHPQRGRRELPTDVEPGLSARIEEAHAESRRSQKKTEMAPLNNTRSYRDPARERTGSSSRRRTGQ